MVSDNNKLKSSNQDTKKFEEANWIFIRRKSKKDRQKGQSESVNRRTNNTMAKRKTTNGRTTIYRALHRKLNIEQQKPH